MAGELRGQLPERCPDCKHDPTGDDNEFVSGGGWVHDVSIVDGAWVETMRCPTCREVVARTEKRPEARP